ncbi:hypothetical protein ES705_37420 [subsurface metagenome]
MARSWRGENKSLHFSMPQPLPLTKSGVLSIGSFGIRRSFNKLLSISAALISLSVGTTYFLPFSPSFITAIIFRPKPIVLLVSFKYEVSLIDPQCGQVALLFETVPLVSKSIPLPCFILISNDFVSGFSIN